MDWQNLHKSSMCYGCIHKDICKTVYQADDCSIQLSNWNCSHFAKTKLVANVTFNKEEVEELVEKAKADILAQIDRPRGEWINHRTIMHDGEYYCSNCDEGAEWLDGGSQFLSNYCPNCGALMKKGGAE